MYSLELGPEIVRIRRDFQTETIYFSEAKLFLVTNMIGIGDMLGRNSMFNLKPWNSPYAPRTWHLLSLTIFQMSAIQCCVYACDDHLGTMAAGALYRDKLIGGLENCFSIIQYSEIYFWFG